MRLFTKNIIVFAALVYFSNLFTGHLLAAEKMVFDSTDRYLGACALTNNSTWTLDKDLQVTTFQVWYNWGSGEKELPVTVLKDNKPFAEFVATRGGCDPYQQQWCNADYKINKSFPAGTYSTQIPTKKQCLKPGGTGTIRLYVDDAASDVKSDASATSKTASIDSTASLSTTSGTDETTTQVTGKSSNSDTTSTSDTSLTAPKDPNVSGSPISTTGNFSKDASAKSLGAPALNCSCDIKTVAATAAGTSFAVSLLVALILRKK